jgi:hypothetical protein
MRSVIVRAARALAGADRHEQRSLERPPKAKTKASTMARPRKQPSEHRSASVRTDLTLAEKVYVQEQATEAGLSEAEYTRRRILGYSVPARAEKQAQAAFVSEINRLGNQLAALGNVANQIALYCHTDRHIPAEWSLLPSEIRGLQRVVEQTLERILLSNAS